jgi:hypothetical protein
MLLPLARILARRSRARVVFLPSDHLIAPSSRSTRRCAAPRAATSPIGWR